MIGSSFIKQFEEDVIEEGSCGSWTRHGKPSWKDIKEERIFIPRDIVDQALKYLDDERGHFCVITGPINSGKTWLCYAIGFELAKDRHTVWFVEENEIGNFKADEAIGCIKEDKGKGKKTRYFIIDGCNNNPDETQRFVDRIRQMGEENFRFLFTMQKTGTAFLEEGRAVDKFYDLCSERDCEISLQDKGIENYRKNIIKKFIEVEDVRKHVGVTEEEIDSAAENWHDLFWLWIYLKEWGSEDGFKKGKKLSEVKEDDIYNNIYYKKPGLDIEDRRRILLPVAALCQFGSLPVLESFLQELHINEEVKNELIEERVIERFEWRGNKFLRMRENPAEVFLKAAASKNGLNHNSDIEEYTKEKFKEYIKIKPPNWIYIFHSLYLARKSKKSELTTNVLTFLLYDDETRKVTKEVMKQSAEKSLLDVSFLLTTMINIGIIKEKGYGIWETYLQDTTIDKIAEEIAKWEISTIVTTLQTIKKIDETSLKNIIAELNNFSSNLKEKLVKASATSQVKFYRLLYNAAKIKCPKCESMVPFKQTDKEICFCRKCGKRVITKDYNLENRIKDLLRVLLRDEHLYRDLQTKLKLSTAETIRSALGPLSTSVALYEFFYSFSDSDYKKIIEKSLTFNSLALLLVDFRPKNYKLNKVAYNFTEAFPDKVALLENLAKKEIDNGFLKLVSNFRRINDQRATKIIDNLSTLDEDKLGKIVSTGKPKHVNHFIQQGFLINKTATLKIINKVDDKSWVCLFDLSPPENDDQIFWTLWNIYRNEPLKTKSIIQSKEARPQNWIDNMSHFIYLPSLGLLHLCGFNVQDIPIDQDIAEIKEILRKLGGERKGQKLKPTQFLLSLIALKIKIPPEQFQDIKRMLNEQPINGYIYNNPNPQLKELFQDLITNYLNE